MDDDLQVPRFRVFLSSPGDVSEERELALRVLERVQGWFRGRCVLEPYFWENEPLFATAGFQDQIDRPSKCDCAVFVLWSRLGTPLSEEFQRKTGTEWEFEDARSSHEENGLPDVLVYRRTGAPRIDLDLPRDEIDARATQLDAVRGFFEKWFRDEVEGSFTGAFHQYATTAQFGELLEAHLTAWLGRKLGDEGTPAATWRGSPYRGLEVFEEEHAPIFFGRTRAIHEIRSRLEEQASKGSAFLLVLGMSGCGKSSLLRAGVLPLYPDHAHLVMRPSEGESPLVALASVLPDRLAQSIRKDARAAASLVPELLGDERLVLVVDQLEELFAADDAESFIELLAALARCPSARVLCSLRNDFYPRLAEHPGLMALKADGGQVDLAPVAGPEFSQVIVLPAQAAGLVFERHPDTSVLLNKVIEEEARADPRSLPLLEYLLDQLYERREGNRLTYAAYGGLGGVEGCLARRAEEVFSALPDDVQRAFPRVMRELVDVASGDDAATRRAAPLERATRTRETSALIDALTEARLLTKERRRDGATVVTVSHEALLRRWPRLQQWLDKDRELLRIRSRVAAAARRWDESGRRRDLLLSAGKPLLEAQQLAAAGMDLESSEREYVETSTRRARRNRRLVRGAVLAIAVLGLGASVLGLWARRAAREAEDRRVEAERERSRATAKAAEAERERARTTRNLAEFHLEEGRRELLSGYPGHALVFLAAAYEPLRSIPARAPVVRMLISGAAKQLPRVTFSGHADRVGSASFSPDGTHVVTASRDTTARVWDAGTGETLASLEGHASVVRTASFSPDGARVVTASQDRTARVWDTGTGKTLAALEGHTGAVWSASFSPDGARVVTASDDKTARVWDAGTGRPLATLEGHASVVWSASFSPDGTRVVTTSHDKTARVWDAGTGKTLATLEGHTEPVYSASFSPDGARVVTTGRDRNARVWDAETGKTLASLQGHAGWVSSASFSPDGARVVTASQDKTARVWDAGTAETLATLEGHASVVWSASFSPDGTRVVTASKDTTARVWDAGTGETLAALDGHVGAVWSASFSPDGTDVVTASQDTTARMWNAATGKNLAVLEGHTEPVWSASFSPFGARVVTTGRGRNARVWDAETGKTLASLQGHAGWVRAASFSPDGARVVTASQDKTARVWDAGTGETLATLEGHSGRIMSAAFSPKGARVVTASRDTTARVWDAGTGETLAALEGHASVVRTASFSPDGARVVTASQDRTARVWDTGTGKTLAALEGHTGAVWSASFSPDGARVVTASDDKTARVWDAGTAKTLATFEGHAEPVYSASFSPDGARVVTASKDTTARVWDAGTGKTLATLEGHASTVRSASFSPDGARVVTASDDTTARVWDAGTGKTLAILNGHDDHVSSASFGPGGARVVTASWDKTARVWDVGLEERSPEEVRALVEKHLPWRLEGSRLVPKER